MHMKPEWAHWNWDDTTVNGVHDAARVHLDLAMEEQEAGTEAGNASPNALTPEADEASGPVHDFGSSLPRHDAVAGFHVETGAGDAETDGETAVDATSSSGSYITVPVVAYVYENDLDASTLGLDMRDPVVTSEEIIPAETVVGTSDDPVDRHHGQQPLQLRPDVPSSEAQSTSLDHEEISSATGYYHANWVDLPRVIPVAEPPPVHFHDILTASLRRLSFTGNYQGDHYGRVVSSAPGEPSVPMPFDSSQPYGEANGAPALFDGVDETVPQRMLSIYDTPTEAPVAVETWRAQCARALEEAGVAAMHQGAQVDPDAAVTTDVNGGSTGTVDSHVDALADVLEATHLDDMSVLMDRDAHAGHPGRI